jgi:uncharacterized protein (DUF427 family)
MATRLEPGPEHPISVTPSTQRLRVIWKGHVVAETTRALDLKETTYPLVHYVPREDADMKYFIRSTRSTHCPYKGDASYFTLRDDTGEAADVVWTYETPYPAVAAIAGHLAFYPQHVTIETA